MEGSRRLQELVELRERMRDVAESMELVDGGAGGGSGSGSPQFERSTSFNSAYSAAAATEGGEGRAEPPSGGLNGGAWSNKDEKGKLER